MTAPDTCALLRDLIAFPTISADPNRALIDYCAALLQDAGAHVQIIEDDTGQKANLYATVGPQDQPGVLLSGHTDVVPVAGQAWTRPPFEITEDDVRLYGRGTADMKGFVAAALSAALRATKHELQTPLHLAFSYDEEIGCVGVRSLIEMLDQAPFRPAFCIVGEPTSMAVATGHKGKTAARVTCHGVEAHSALAPTAVNAIHLACDMVGVIRRLQDRLAQRGMQDADYDIPYTTLHVGAIAGGGTLNIVPNHADFLFEIRNLAGDDPQVLMDEIRQEAKAMLAPIQAEFPEAAITFHITNAYPGLDTPKSAEVVQFVHALTGDNATIKVAFGTEGGLFSSHLGIPTVICGPGSMAQGHKPDEFIEIQQLKRCDAMLAALIQRLADGL